MPESNDSTNETNPGPSSVPSGVPDFRQELRNAKATGDFDFVIETAKKSHRMLLDFRDAICGGSFDGKYASALAMGLNFLENMIGSAAAQVTGLKNAEKQTREAIRNAAKNKAPLNVVDPNKPAEPTPPETTADAPQPPEQSA